MQTNIAQSSQQDMLGDMTLTKMIIGYGPSLKELSTMFSGCELVETIIKNAQQYTIGKLGYRMGTPLSELDSHALEAIRGMTSGILQRWVPSFISDAHREFIVRCHARGLSTSDAVEALIAEDETIERLIHPDAIGLGPLRRVLVTRLAYLKPGSTRWPEKKYGAIWRKEREQHKEEIRDIPLTSPTEQAVLLAQHAGRINSTLKHDAHSATDWQSLTNSLVKTLDSLRKVSAVEQQEPTNLSGMQLIGVLERLTLALDAPEQLALGTDTDALVGVLERLTLALKSPDQKVVASEVKAIPADTNADDNSSV